jgi:hypothetical protein
MKHMYKGLAMLFVFVFMISLATASFLPIKTYSDKDKTVTVSNFLGLGKDYATATLTWGDTEVGVGKDTHVGTFTFTPLHEDAYISDLGLIDLKNRKTMTRGKQFKVLTYVKDDLYSTVCDDVWNKTYGNYTQNCYQVENGTYLKEEWKPLNSWLNKNSFVVGKTYTIGVFVDTEEGDYGDWIPTLMSSEIDKWSSWTASLNTNLISYYKFDEQDTTGGGTIIDSVGNCNATNNGADNSTGKIGTAYTYVSSNTNYIEISCSELETLSDGMTIYFWMDGSGGNAYATPLSRGAYTTNGDFAFRKGGNLIYFDIYGVGGDDQLVSTSDVFDGNEHFVLMNALSNGTYQLWIDNNLEDTFTYDFMPNSNNFFFGMRGGSDRAYNGWIDEAGFRNQSSTTDEITQLYNEGDGITYTLNFDTSPNATLYSPIDEYNSTSQTIDLTWNATDNQAVENVSLIVDDVYVYTNSSPTNATAQTYNYDFGADGTFAWKIEACDNASACTNSSEWNVNIDTTDPVISTAYNLTDLTVLSLPTNSTWHFNATDTHIDSCYYNTSDDATLQVISCNSTQVTNWTTQGTKTIQFCANDTFGFETCNTTTIDIYLIATSQADNPDPIVEGYPVTFNLTVNMTDLPTTTAYLIFNTSSYLVSGTAGQNGSYFETTINVPTDYGNTTGFPQTWYWNYTIDGVITNESTASQTLTVYELAIDNCTDYGEVILDLSLKDEETNALINSSAGSTIEIDLDLVSVDNSSLSLSYSKKWENFNHTQVCIPLNVINNTEWYMNFTIGFDSTDRVWEFYYLDLGILNSTKVFNGQTDYTIDLMNLKTDDSTSFLFNYFDIDGLTVDDIIVHTFRKYIGDGVFREVERSKNDENGDTIVHLVEEDVIYYFLITKYGEVLYTSSTYTALCQATPCTIQLEASGDSAVFDTDWDLIEGGSYSINESSSERQVTLIYDLTESEEMNFTVYKYDQYGNFSAIDTASSSATEDQLTLDIPLSAGNVSFFVAVTKGDEFIKSQWVDFEDNAEGRFGSTLSIFLAILIILTLGLIAITEGSNTIIMVILGIFLSGALGLITTKLSTGVNIIVYLILAGGLIVWKISQGKK